MSVFGAIKDAIFGKDDAPAAATPPAPTAAPAAAPTAAAPATAPTPAAAPAPAAKPAPTPEAIDRVLAAKTEARGEPLNYNTSIVDLMKALGLDSSIGERKKLATELGYPGDQDDSATMNVWLHGKVMERLLK